MTTYDQWKTTEPDQSSEYQPQLCACGVGLVWTGLQWVEMEPCRCDPVTDYSAYSKLSDTEWDYREECITCQNEGGHLPSVPHKIIEEHE